MMSFDEFQKLCKESEENECIKQYLGTQFDLVVHTGTDCTKPNRGSTDLSSLSHFIVVSNYTNRLMTISFKCKPVYGYVRFLGSTRTDIWQDSLVARPMYQDKQAVDQKGKRIGVGDLRSKEAEPYEVFEDSILWHDDKGDEKNTELHPILKLPVT